MVLATNTRRSPPALTTSPYHACAFGLLVFALGLRTAFGADLCTARAVPVGGQLREPLLEALRAEGLLEDGKSGETWAEEQTRLRKSLEAYRDRYRIWSLSQNRGGQETEDAVARHRVSKGELVETIQKLPHFGDQEITVVHVHPPGRPNDGVHTRITVGRNLPSGFSGMAYVGLSGQCHPSIRTKVPPARLTALPPSKDMPGDGRYFAVHRYDQYEGRSATLIISSGGNAWLSFISGLNN